MTETRMINRDMLSALKDARLIAVLIAVPAFGWFVFAQIDLWSRNGIWGDEYFSVWASDPRQPFSLLFEKRIFPDSNPPLYYSLLYLYRLAISEPRAAFIALNLTALVLTAGAIVWNGRRAGLFLTAIACAALFAIGGPALTYAPEGRAYFLALCVSVAIAWFAAQIVETSDQGRANLMFAILGAVAALIHPFAALVAGGFGAGLLGEGLLRRRADLIRAGLWLGAATTLVFGTWLVFAMSRIGNLGYLEFTPSAVKEAVWYVRQLAAGPNLIVLAIAAFLGLSALRRDLWPIFRVFAIAAALFMALPLLASFKTPLISGRYWLIGAPILLVTLVFAMRAHLMAVLSDRADRRTQATTALGALCLVAVTGFGFANGRAMTEAKPIWRGAAMVRSLIADCPAGSVRVPRWRAIYATAADAPESVFVDLSADQVSPLDARAARCPVIGWAEHVQRGDRFMSEASDEDLLALLSISGKPGEDVRVVRHNSGFVALRADAPR